MGQESFQLLTHMWIINMTQKPWYITEKGMERKREGNKRKNKENKGG